jgi:hypothetical protein
VCGVDHRQLDEGEAGSGVRPLGRFAAAAAAVALEVALFGTVRVASRRAGTSSWARAWKPRFSAVSVLALPSPKLSRRRIARVNSVNRT